MPTAQQLLRDAVEKLKRAGVDTSVLDAEVLLSKATCRSRTELLAHPESQPSADEADQFELWVNRRADREPLAYIIGEREFYGISFQVTPAVLVPRQETETLVDAAIELLKDKANPLVADIGLGSGAVAVSIAHAVPHAIIYGTESSEAALEVAERNARHAGVRVDSLKGDLLAPLVGERFDLIVSNPPYIPSAEIDALQPEISKYEPRQALDGGPDGLDYHRRLTSESPAYLKCGGILALEVGLGQAEAVKALFADNGFVNVRSVRDLMDIERVVLGERP